MPQRTTPNEFQKAARSFVRMLIESSREQKIDPPVTPPRKGSEAWYRDRLARQLKGKTEVSTTDGGRIDILTATEVIEVK